MVNGTRTGAGPSCAGSNPGADHVAGVVVGPFAQAEQLLARHLTNHLAGAGVDGLVDEGADARHPL